LRVNYIGYWMWNSERMMTEKPGIAGKRKACGWDEKTRDKVIGIKTSEKRENDNV